MSCASLQISMYEGLGPGPCSCGTFFTFHFIALHFTSLQSLEPARPGARESGTGFSLSRVKSDFEWQSRVHPATATRPDNDRGASPWPTCDCINHQPDLLQSGHNNPRPPLIRTSTEPDPTAVHILQKFPPPVFARKPSLHFRHSPAKRQKAKAFIFVRFFLRFC